MTSDRDEIEKACRYIEAGTFYPDEAVALIRRLMTERDEARAEARTLRNLAVTSDEARNKALDEAAAHVRKTLINEHVTRAIANSILALKSKEPT